jgi:glc operon protein GlcG
MRIHSLLLTLSFIPVLAHAVSSQPILTQVDSDRIIAAGESSALALKATVCVAVVDQSGQLLAFKRMDDAPPGCIDASILKARSAAIYRTATLGFMERVNGKEPALVTLPGMVPLGGGTPVLVAGRVLGAVGVSGSSNPNEVSISVSAAAGLAGMKGVAPTN